MPSISFARELYKRRVAWERKGCLFCCCTKPFHAGICSLHGDSGKGGSAKACARQICSWVIQIAPSALDSLLGSVGETCRCLADPCMCCTGRARGTQGDAGIQELDPRDGQVQPTVPSPQLHFLLQCRFPRQAAHKTSPSSNSCAPPFIIIDSASP